MKMSHLYHLVDSSPWPLVSAFGSFFLVFGLLLTMNRMSYGMLFFLFGLMFMMGVMYVWWSDMLSESVYQGYHTEVVQKGLSYGMMLFITSEVMLFFAFFWAFFHSSLSPSVEIGGVWPPVGMSTLPVWHMPALNTAILVFSSVVLTASHKSLVMGDVSSFKVELLFTMVLGFIFECLQVMEYYEALFTMTDSIYGTTFFMLTGLHGLHVLVGALFLLIYFLSIFIGTINVSHHKGFLFAIWYWHFVDVVWVFLFIFVYIWGSW